MNLLERRSLPAHSSFNSISNGCDISITFNTQPAEGHPTK